MKKLSSVFYMWVGFGFGLLAVLMMFTPFINLDGGNILPATKMFWSDSPIYGSAWPAFVGFMLILVGAVMMGVMALPIIQPSIKTEKIVLISSGALILIGAILVALIYVEYRANNGIYNRLEEFRAGYYLTLSFAAIALGMDVVALVLDW